VRPDVRVLGPGELRAAHGLFAATLLRGPVADEQWPSVASSYSPDRTLGVGDPGALAGTATSFPTRTVVPGGATLPTAAVTRVGVRADRTRRGLLTAMMTELLHGCAARGEVLASLRASEARIYGRFGYGVASRGRQVRMRRAGFAGWRPGAPVGGAVRLLDRSGMVETLAAVHDALPLSRPGAIERTAGWWESALGRHRAGRDPLLVAVHTGARGDDGSLVATVERSRDPEAGDVLRVEDLYAVSTAATAALWRFVLDVDLVGTVEGWLRPLDEPLELILADPRDCATSGHEDETWLRLVDVPAALAARRFGTGPPVLVAVHDGMLPTNSGVYRIADGAAERVPGSPEPDLACDVAGLAMAYLGDRRPSELVAAGWWTADDPAAATRADAAFATDVTPWCGTYFSGPPRRCSACAPAASAARSRSTEPPRPHRSVSASSASGSAGAAGSVSDRSSCTGASRATRTTGSTTARYGSAACSRLRTVAERRVSARSVTAARSSAHEPNRLTSVAAVFAPTPGTPGRPSEGSPRSIAISAYASPARPTGTPYFAATSTGPRCSAFANPRPT